jgi:hypothetical protein
MSEDRELEEIKRRMLERMTSPPSKSNILRDGVVNVLTDKNGNNERPNYHVYKSLKFHIRDRWINAINISSLVTFIINEIV